MRKKKSPSKVSFNAEPLESRLLFAWGAIPQLIDQDLAVANYGQYNGAGQTIAIIDTGVDYTHPTISGKYLGGYDFVNNDNDPMDTDGHGTGIASLIVGSTYSYNGAQYQGVAPGARIVALRVDDNNTVPDSRYEDAFGWIIDHREQYNITVVNASFGDGHYSTEAQRAVYADEMAQLAAAGVVIVASSGNDGVISPFGVEYPAADPSAYAIGSVTSGDVIATHTERGPIMDLLAPGVAVPMAYVDANGDPVYTQGDGTSFASPFAAGAAAIIKQIDPTFSAADVMSVLRASGVDNFDGDSESGTATYLSWPRLDVDNAIALALSRQSGNPTAQLGVNGRDNAIKFDRDGVLYWTWYDANSTDLKFATRSNNGAWSTIQTIDSAGDVGHYVSLAITSTGKPAVAYYDATNADLKFALWEGNRWSVALVDGRRSTGMYPSLAFDQYDDWIITHYYKTGGDLRMAYNDGSGWSISTIDSTDDVGRYSSFVISNTGQFSVAYENTTNGTFRFARKYKSWAIEAADATTRGGGGYISLAYNASNQPGISYYDAYNADLKFAQYNGSSWSKTTVASTFSQGLYTNLMYSGSTAEIVYFDRTQDALARATGTIGNWSFDQLANGGGRHAFTAWYGSEHMLTYWDTASLDLAIRSY